MVWVVVDKDITRKLHGKVISIFGVFKRENEKEGKKKFARAYGKSSSCV